MPLFLACGNSNRSSIDQVAASNQSLSDVCLYSCPNWRLSKHAVEECVLMCWLMIVDGCRQTLVQICSCHSGISESVVCTLWFIIIAGSTSGIGWKLFSGCCTCSSSSWSASCREADFASTARGTGSGVELRTGRHGARVSVETHNLLESTGDEGRRKVSEGVSVSRTANVSPRTRVSSVQRSLCSSD